VETRRGPGWGLDLDVGAHCQTMIRVSGLLC